MVDRMGKQVLSAAGQRTMRRMRQKWQLYLLILPAIVSVFIFRCHAYSLLQYVERTLFRRN